MKDLFGEVTPVTQPRAMWLVLRLSLNRASSRRYSSLQPSLPSSAESPLLTLPIPHLQSLTSHTHVHAAFKGPQSGTWSAESLAGRPVLNIGRLGPGGEKYYLTHVASGAEDYYLAQGEAPGRWIGRGAELLGLEGRVEAEPLRAVLSDRDPRDGEQLTGHPARKVPGFDLSFRPPKSVSLLWGLGGGRVAAEVREAHDAAVAETLGYLEREAGFTRRGAAGREHVRANGFVGAAFSHRTSRAGDPLLHTHVVVANLAQTVDDGVWRTLDSRRLYRHAKTAGFLYQAHLRHELTRRLGVEWEPVVNGHADLAGIPRQLIEAFSQRRAQILAAMDERGEHSAKAAQVATLETRRAKELQASEPQLRRSWAVRARGHGFDPANLDALLGRVGEREHHPDAPALAEAIVGEEGLTAHEASFARRDVVRAMAERLPTGAAVREIEEIADTLLADRRLVALGPARNTLTVRQPDDEQGESRYTTESLLAVEFDAVAGALARRAEGVAAVPAAGVGFLVRRHRNLGWDQRAMVERLTTSGAGVEVVVGKAGAGKTYALAVAHDAWQRARVPVIGGGPGGPSCARSAGGLRHSLHHAARAS